MSDKIELIPYELLPKTFQYPKELLWLADRNLHLWQPWIIETGKGLVIRFKGLKDRYPNRQLIPFASRLDCDDVACWDLASPGRIALIHDFAKSPFEQVKWYEGFWEWFIESVRDTIEFAKIELNEI